ncbi:unnamed protein product [Bemisia tabaci]|uniref:Uncharacterized protein n=1 Tax=Bemisia tabaci TaxID=7038 RepID=A0A9P0A5C3_BEMTA|nr:unnamed protein product [Bemisia tabaci]
MVAPTDRRFSLNRKQTKQLLKLRVRILTDREQITISKAVEDTKDSIRPLSSNKSQRCEDEVKSHAFLGNNLFRIGFFRLKPRIDFEFPPELRVLSPLLWVCEDFPDLKLPLETNILSDYNTRSHDRQTVKQASRTDDTQLNGKEEGEAEEEGTRVKWELILRGRGRMINCPDSRIAISCRLAGRRTG